MCREKLIVNKITNNCDEIMIMYQMPKQDMHEVMQVAIYSR